MAVDAVLRCMWLLVCVKPARLVSSPPKRDALLQTLLSHISELEQFAVSPYYYKHGSAAASNLGQPIEEDRYIPYAMQIVRSAHVLRMYLKYLKSDNMKNKYMNPTNGRAPVTVESILSQFKEDDLFKKAADAYGRLSELDSRYGTISIFTPVGFPTESLPSVEVAWAQCNRELGWMAQSIKELMHVADPSSCIGKIIRAHPFLEAALKEIWTAARLVVNSTRTDAIVRLLLSGTLALYKDEWVRPDNAGSRRTFWPIGRWNG